MVGSVEVDDPDSGDRTGQVAASAAEAAVMDRAAARCHSSGGSLIP